MKLLERFKQKYIKTSCGCWVWLAGETGLHYGGFWFQGTTCLAHRVSYILYKGNIPKDLNICHKCGNSLCVNPDHLYAGTQAENITDKIKHGTHISGPKHYLYGKSLPKHTLKAAVRAQKPKFSKEDVLNIRKDYESGEYTMKGLARKYNGCRRHISNIARYKIRV